MSDSVVDTGSEDADRGTACHLMLARCLRDGEDPRSFIGQIFNVGEDGRRSLVPVTDEMVGWVAEVVTWVLDYLARHPGSHLRVEERVVVGRAFGVPDQLWGTPDVQVASRDELLIADAKFGYGEVAVAGNPQIGLYAIGGAHDYGWIFDRYRLAILQPQTNPPFREEELTPAQLLDLQRRYAPRVAAALEPDAPRVANDEACRWCPAAGVCPTLQERALVLARREFAAVELLSAADLSTLLQHADRIRAGLLAAEEHAVRRILMGGQVPSFKVVAGDKHRVWKDEVAALRLLKSLGFSRNELRSWKTITPAQAEKLVGRATARQLAPFIEKPKGAPTLAPESDPREPLLPEFQALDPDLPPDEDLIAGRYSVLPADAAAGKKSSAA